MLLTPQLARQWLTAGGWTPTPPAPGHQDRVNHYAAAMRAGQWRDNSPITFRSGRLVDGVHRCWAVIRSEVTIQVAVLDL
jgi:hypothetical protein